MDKAIRISIGYNKSISVKNNGPFRNVYINDNVFENGEFVRDKSKYVWLKWSETLHLRDAINSIEEQIVSVEGQGERKVELLEGCGVYITKSQKASLAITGFKDARKVTIRLLDTLFDQKELAVMSAVGARQAHNRKAGVQTQAMPRHKNCN